MKYWDIFGKRVIAKAFNRNYENVERKKVLKMLGGKEDLFR